MLEGALALRADDDLLWALGSGWLTALDPMTGDVLVQWTLEPADRLLVDSDDGVMLVEEAGEGLTVSRVGLTGLEPVGEGCEGMWPFTWSPYATVQAGVLWAIEEAYDAAGGTRLSGCDLSTGEALDKQAVELEYIAFGMLPLPGVGPTLYSSSGLQRSVEVETGTLGRDQAPLSCMNVVDLALLPDGTVLLQIQRNRTSDGVLTESALAFARWDPRTGERFAVVDPFVLQQQTPTRTTQLLAGDDWAVLREADDLEMARYYPESTLWGHATEQTFTPLTVSALSR